MSDCSEFLELPYEICWGDPSKIIALKPRNYETAIFFPLDNSSCIPRQGGIYKEFLELT